MLAKCYPAKEALIELPAETQAQTEIETEAETKTAAEMQCRTIRMKTTITMFIEFSLFVVRRRRRRKSNVRSSSMT